MFEEVRLGCPQERSIVLQTHRGTNIKNSIALHPVPDFAAAKFERLCREHTGWVIRKPPTGIYNCFGHVWASRRTAVYDPFDEHVLRVRTDDDYRVVDWNANELPCAGDVASYWEETNPYRNCYHVGRVAYLVSRKDLPPRVFVLSKWDDVSGEVLHDATDYPRSWGNVKLEYWTDRPAGATARKVLT